MAIECISADGRFLHPLIIWPAATHRSSWTTHPMLSQIVFADEHLEGVENTEKNSRLVHVIHLQENGKELAAGLLSTTPAKRDGFERLIGSEMAGTSKTK
jgi:hypothetical protein